MRWLYVTVGLLVTSACLVGWIYLRDRDTNWRPPERQLASADAAYTLNAVGGVDCRSGCAAKVLGHTGSHRWLVRINVKGKLQCLQINLYTFRTSQQYGLSGVHGVQPVPPTRCVLHPTGRTKA